MHHILQFTVQAFLNPQATESHINIKLKFTHCTLGSIWMICSLFGCVVFWWANEEQVDRSIGSKEPPVRTCKREKVGVGGFFSHAINLACVYDRTIH